MKPTIERALAPLEHELAPLKWEELSAKDLQSCAEKCSRAKDCLVPINEVLKEFEYHPDLCNEINALDEKIQGCRALEKVPAVDAKLERILNEIAKCKSLDEYLANKPLAQAFLKDLASILQDYERALKVSPQRVQVENSNRARDLVIQAQEIIRQFVIQEEKDTMERCLNALRANNPPDQRDLQMIHNECTSYLRSGARLGQLVPNYIVPFAREIADLQTWANHSLHRIHDLNGSWAVAAARTSLEETGQGGKLSDQSCIDLERDYSPLFRQPNVRNLMIRLTDEGLDRLRRSFVQFFNPFLVRQGCLACFGVGDFSIKEHVVVTIVEIDAWIKGYPEDAKRGPWNFAFDPPPPFQEI